MLPTEICRNNQSRQPSGLFLKPTDSPPTQNEDPMNNKLTQSLIRLYLRFSGFSYTNLARLFMRLFVGVMFMQFGIRQLVHFPELSNEFPSLFGLSTTTCLVIMITIELLCSLMIMIGFLTRFATIPSILSMIAAEIYIIKDLLPHEALWVSPRPSPAISPSCSPASFFSSFLPVRVKFRSTISFLYS